MERNGVYRDWLAFQSQTVRWPLMELQILALPDQSQFSASEAAAWLNTSPLRATVRRCCWHSDPVATRLFQGQRGGSTGTESSSSHRDGEERGECLSVSNHLNKQGWRTQRLWVNRPEKRRIRGWTAPARRLFPPLCCALPRLQSDSQWRDISKPEPPLCFSPPSLSLNLSLLPPRSLSHHPRPSRSGLSPTQPS